MDVIQIFRTFKESRVKGQKMPNLKDVVDFLKERAFVPSHHLFCFLSKSGTPNGFVYSLRVTNPESCPMCHQRHLLYRCEVFKSKTPRESNAFVKQKKISFNCINSTKPTQRSAPQSGAQYKSVGRHPYTLALIWTHRGNKPAKKQF